MRREEEIGPGTYVDQSQPWSRRTQINTFDRQTSNINTDAPSPGTYTIGVRDSRIGRKIGEIIPQVSPPDVNDTMISAPNRPVDKRPHSVFQRSIPRVAFEVQTADVPGPGTYFASKSKSFQPEAVPFLTGAIRFDRHETTGPSPSDYAVVPPRPESTRCATSHFMSRTPAPVWASAATPDILGPGSYNARAARMRSQLSPDFADRSKRLEAVDNGIPSPAEYRPQTDHRKPLLMLNSRTPKYEDWVLSQVHDSPSPEAYEISRDFPIRPITIPKATPPRKKPKKETVGPGSYETGPGTLFKKSFNSHVPPAASALG
jgi:hypothetical protein